MRKVGGLGGQLIPSRSMALLLFLVLYRSSSHHLVWFDFLGKRMNIPQSRFGTELPLYYSHTPAYFLSRFACLTLTNLSVP